VQNKPLLYAITGFILGGLVVSIAAVTIEKPKEKTNNSTAMSSMVSSLKGKTGDDFDKAFISGMVEHHQGAIEMAEQAKKNAKHTEVKDMAEDIISAHSKEIELMKSWQSQWGYMSNNTTPDANNMEGMQH
jgi:uncharacterized protein (DUF305 family)